MKTLLAQGLAFLLCSSFAYGLKCYQCESQDSFDACDETRINTTCADGADRCLKAGVTGKLSGKEVKGFFKGCAKKAECDDTDNLCKKKTAAAGLTDATCDIYCCDSNLCNGGQVPLVSFIVLSACALAAFIRLFH